MRRDVWEKFGITRTQDEIAQLLPERSNLPATYQTKFSELDEAYKTHTRVEEISSMVQESVTAISRLAHRIAFLADGDPALEAELRTFQRLEGRLLGELIYRYMDRP